MKDLGPLFVPPGAHDGLPWVAILSIALAVPAVVLLVVGILRGRRMPAAVGALAVVLPVASFGFGSLYVMEGSKQASFCGSCHIMTPLLQSLDEDNGSLASIHYRRGRVRHDEPCYTCHSGYGIWGTVEAKQAGLLHMWHTVTGDYARPLAMIGKFDIESCLACHAETHPFRDAEPHRDPDVQKALLDGEMSCTGVCHPSAHPESALNGKVAAR